MRIEHLHFCVELCEFAGRPGVRISQTSYNPHTQQEEDAVVVIALHQVRTMIEAFDEVTKGAEA